MLNPEQRETEKGGSLVLALLVSGHSGLQIHSTWDWQDGSVDKCICYQAW